jgi:hypothetical protein
VLRSDDGVRAPKEGKPKNLERLHCGKIFERKKNACFLKRKLEI